MMAVERRSCNAGRWERTSTKSNRLCFDHARSCATGSVACLVAWPATLPILNLLTLAKLRVIAHLVSICSDCGRRPARRPARRTAMARPDLIIFDCDGVLIDSEVLSCRCLSE